MFVKVGDRVKMGQLMCSIEGLYKKKDIKSGTDGVISRVNYQKGIRVEEKDVLFEFKGTNIYEEVEKFNRYIQPHRDNFTRQMS